MKPVQYQWERLRNGDEDAHLPYFLSVKTNKVKGKNLNKTEKKEPMNAHGFSAAI
ncbi:hypothetical protein ACRTEV_10330 [Rossellomorea arthrocnemi]